MRGHESDNLFFCRDALLIALWIGALSLLVRDTGIGE
jgi:hypothetical protein